jgi:uroporphyrinogen decarboxylase
MKPIMKSNGKTKSKHTENKLRALIEKAASVRKRIVAPLMGFPGVRLIGSTVKIAQQNCREHFKAIKKLNDQFAPDIVFPLMDLSVEANALGFYTVFPINETPTVPQSAFEIQQLKNLTDIDIAFDARIMGYVETVRLMSLHLPDHVIKGAFITGPFTLAALMMGAGNAAMAVLENSRDLHVLCDFTTNVILKYVRLLIAAGSELICVLEPSAVFLGPEQFEEFSVAYLKRIIRECDKNAISTIYHICGNTNHLIGEMVKSGITGISLDSPETGVHLENVVNVVPRDIIVLGNISPTQVMLFGKSEDVRREVFKLLEATKKHDNFVLSTGCDLPLETSEENINAFMLSARECCR